MSIFRAKGLNTTRKQAVKSNNHCASVTIT